MMVVGVDFDIPYVVAPDLAVVARDPSTVQIGTQPPRRMLITDAPAGTREILAALDGSRRLGEVIVAGDGDPVQWHFLAADLIAADILVPAPRRPADPRLAGSRLTLLRRHGAMSVDRMLTARADAVAVVDGYGTLADRVADLLVESGVGTVHQQAQMIVPGEPTPIWRHHAVVSQSGDILRLRRSAPQIPPSIVIATHAIGPAQMAELMLGLIPHLCVAAGPDRVVVGPLVLPGRSACLHCLDRYRRHADPEEPADMPRLTPPASPTAVVAAAACTVDQALTLIDGAGEPEAVDTTIEYTSGRLAPRYRNWAMHAACGCRRFVN